MRIHTLLLLQHATSASNQQHDATFPIDSNKGSHTIGSNTINNQPQARNTTRTFVQSEATPYEALAHYTWDTELSVMMEDPVVPCTKRGFAPRTYKLVRDAVQPHNWRDTSLIVFTGDMMPLHKAVWSVTAQPCIVRIIVFTLVEGWTCAVLAPTLMEIDFEQDTGYISTVVREVSKPSPPRDSLRPLLFWRGGTHFPKNCWSALAKKGYAHSNPRAELVKLAKQATWLNASFKFAPQSEFLKYRYLLDVGGSSCTT